MRATAAKWIFLEKKRQRAGSAGLLQGVSYLDPPVRLDQLSEVTQRCLLTVRLLRRCFICVLGSDPGPSSRCRDGCAGDDRLLPRASRCRSPWNQAVERRSSPVGTRSISGEGPAGCQRAKLMAALRSRSIAMPQATPEYVRVDSSRSFLISPQPEHFLELGKNRSATRTSTPCHRTL